MANARIVLLKPCEIVRDEPLKQPGDVVILTVEAAAKLVASGKAVMNADFTESMLPKKPEDDKKSEEAKDSKDEKKSDEPKKPEDDKKQDEAKKGK
jgi:hypothetical protein